MKKFEIIKRWLTALLLVSGLASAATRVEGQTVGVTAGAFYLTTGQPITNQFTFQAWPPGNQWVVMGTNLIWEGYIYTNQPNITASQLTPGPAGYFTNQLYPGFYAVKVPALGNNVFFYALVPSTTQTVSLASCATNVIAFYANANNYQYVSNLFGFDVATNGFAGLVAGLGYAPATNSPAGIAYALGYWPEPTNYAPTLIGTTPGMWSVATNGFEVWAAMKTNGNPGNVLTNLPWGTICSTTNGQFFVLSNQMWNLK